MARKKRDPAAEDIAKRILAEYSPKTADEAQEALRSVLLIAPFLLHRSTLHCYSVPWQTAT